MNIQNSNVIALDSWNTSLKVMDIPYYTQRCLVFINRIPNMSQRKKAGMWRQHGFEHKFTNCNNGYWTWTKEYDMYRNTFWRERGIKTKSPTTQRQPEANQHVYLMIFFLERRNISGPIITLQRTKKKRVWSMIHLAPKYMALF